MNTASLINLDTEMAMDDIQLAQVSAAEDAVVERLRQSAFAATYKSEPFTDVKRGGFWCRCSLGFALESDLIAHLTAHDGGPRENLRQSLQVALAIAFVSMQATYEIAERQGYWFECLRLAKEIERLGVDNAANKV